MSTQANTLPGVVAAAAPALKGFDADTVISADVAQQFKQAGYAFCGRYLSLGNGQAAGDLTYAEARAILNAGLALVAVQHVPESGWSPDATLGSSYGTNAAANAVSIGLPKGMNLWCDLEGIQGQVSADNVTAYCQAWFDAVSQAGYVPGLYVGANCILDGNQLYDLSFQHYWQSLSEVPTIPNRGYQLIQSDTTSEFGVGIDTDTTQTDGEGGNVLWVVVT